MGKEIKKDETTKTTTKTTTKSTTTSSAKSVSLNDIVNKNLAKQGKSEVKVSSTKYQNTAKKVNDAVSKSSLAKSGVNNNTYTPTSSSAGTPRKTNSSTTSLAGTTKIGKSVTNPTYTDLGLNIDAINKQEKESINRSQATTSKGASDSISKVGNIFNFINASAKSTLDIKKQFLQTTHHRMLLILKTRLIVWELMLQKRIWKKQRLLLKTIIF